MFKQHSLGTTRDFYGLPIFGIFPILITLLVPIESPPLLRYKFFPLISDHPGDEFPPDHPVEYSRHYILIPVNLSARRRMLLQCLFRIDLQIPSKGRHCGFHCEFQAFSQSVSQSRKNLSKMEPEI